MDCPRSRLLLSLALAGAILAVSTASLFIRYAQQENVPSVVIAAWRLTLATLFLTPAALSKHRGEVQHLKPKTAWLGLLGGVFLALHFAAWITSLEYTSVASSVVLVTTTPIWVALCAPLVLGERVGTSTLAGMFLALVGGAILTLGGACLGEQEASPWVCSLAGQVGQESALAGNALALVGAWMAAGYVLVGRKVRARISLLSYLFLVYGIAAIFLIGMMFASRQQPWGYPASAYLWLCLLALVPQLVGHSTLNWALRYLPAAFVSVTLLGEPVGASLLAALFLGEMPRPVEILGGVVILAGIYLVSREPTPSLASSEKE